jgi:DhnA family fructose-bisphosphate aldolase class Ia
VTSQVGKAMRMKRVIDGAGVSVICALDHGMTSPTFLEPLADIRSRAEEAVAGGANVIMMS